MYSLFAARSKPGMLWVGVLVYVLMHVYTVGMYVHARLYSRGHVDIYGLWTRWLGCDHTLQQTLYMGANPNRRKRRVTITN